MHIATLLNDPGSQQLAMTLVQQEACAIDGALTFRKPVQQQLLVGMIELINKYSGAVQLKIFLQAEGIFGFKVIRNQHAAAQKSQVAELNVQPAAQATYVQPSAVHLQPQFGMIE